MLSLLQAELKGIVSGWVAVLGETQRLSSLPGLEPVQLTAYNGPSGIPPAGKPVKDLLVNEQVQSLSQQLAQEVSEQFDSLSHGLQVSRLSPVQSFESQLLTCNTNGIRSAQCILT